ncbi:hypothetical protein L249_7079 [Ophiocordyceps polyrhachis-furcata BCC 54312]|uniref:Uncharacterized protein n=1 Tax=Ophiocordyceps polyrhachis-furcata BCC 54312 TaxID=1330021 RepID=A0A367LK19_9HYPO|nr:hypothetical protein L249_7079 [Ophiocordyceps polyrhachis-furcata BCC 54312]
MIWVSGPSSSCSLIRANASSDLFLIGIVIAARELGKSDFLSIRHDFSIRKNMGKKAVEEEEGSKKLVEIIKVWITIEEELKAGEVIVGKPPSFIDKFLNNKGDLEEDFNVGRYDRYWYSASIAVTITYSAPIDVQRADRCDDRCNESIGRYDRYSPTVTQGVWPYRLISYPFKMKKYALYSS